MNQFTLVGRISSDPKEYTTRHGKQYVTFTLAVKRPFRSKNKEYLTDYIPVKAWRHTAGAIIDQCGKGSLITLQGRMNPMTYLPEDHALYNKIELLAESIGFHVLISPTKADSEDLVSAPHFEQEGSGDAHANHLEATVH